MSIHGNYIHCGVVQCLRVTRSIMGFVDIDRVAAGILRIKCQKIHNRTFHAFLFNMISICSREVFNFISHLLHECDSFRYDCKLHSMRYKSYWT